MWFWNIKVIFLASFICHYYNTNVNGDPVGTGGPAVVTEGKDALLTCVVMSPFMNDTVLWKKGPNTILSAGMNRVTNDKRMSILHDESPSGKSSSGGEVWVLLIRDAKPSDSGVYACEVNSEPILRSFHTLRVKSIQNKSKTPTDSPDLQPPLPDPSSKPTELTTMPPPITHDFTECCQSLNVSQTCIGFCTVHNIMDGTTGNEAENCEIDFPNIVKCMADGRNHIPCCAKAKIPDLCQDMCRGEYTPFTDYLKSRVTCVAHTLPALNCILEGIENLPSEPENVYVEPLTEKSLQVIWQAPEKLGETVKYYLINVTVLHTFDQDSLPNDTATMSITVAGEREYTISDLKPFTMYSITVTAFNEHGSSLPSYRVRALTLESGVGKHTSVAEVPVLPDVKGCCMKNGMTHRSCMDKMCDPKRADFTEVPDLMVCAPWANITFSCLANNIDHSPCCKSRGIPDTCLALCSGNIKTINYNFFKCLQYMSDYSSCLLQGYGVLAGPPSRLKAPLIADHFVILEWYPPKILPDTVTSYHLHYRKLGSGEEYSVVEKDHPPMILEDLEAASYYEVFIVALNAHGKGGPSPRLVFQTKHKTEKDMIMPGYNMTSCCHSYGLLPQCQPLCTYDIKMSDLKRLEGICQNQLGVLIKCMAGARDHTPCCQRRSVTPQCISACRGVVSQPAADCFSYIGNIIQCFEDGTNNIPGPIENLRVLSVTNSSISIQWAASEDDQNSTDSKLNDFLIQYGKVDNMTLYETVVRLDNEINTTETEIELTNLEPNCLYRISVVARGDHGSSLPSAMLLINTTSEIEYNTKIFGSPSPPHLLNLVSHSATWVQLSWQPPEFSHPHEHIAYKVYHKSTSAEKFTVMDTRLLWTKINNLKPNSQHVVYVVAIGEKGISLPSETLVAWTDPALPAFVDPPTIHPSDIIPEGGSMTVLCLALGNPAPTISLYIGGHLVRQDTSRHMVTVIHNVTTDMEHVSCYADNGYGIPMQASKKVNISYSPRIQASGITVASLGEAVDLKCTVRAKPNPKAIFWRDQDGRIPVIQDGNFEMSLTSDEDDTSLYTMTLHISKLGTAEVGDYFCHAENALGSQTRPVSVRMRNMAAVHNISECCINQNVSTTCRSACSFYVDIDAVIDRPECIVDFDKLMKCAADGSDHRACCAAADVPRKCLNWCRGEPLGSSSLCALNHMRSIIGCFQTNRDRLPGPPQNLQVQITAVDEVLITWEPPMKNPHMVEGYRVFWHDVDPANDNNFSNTINGLGTSRLDAKETSIRIDGLKQDVMYELVVKAGNHYGASILTEPLRFTLGDHTVTSASRSSNAATVSGILAGIIAIAFAIAALLFYKKRKTGHKSANGVAFENPSYLREVNMEHVHIPAVSAETATDWRQESLQPPIANGIDSNSMVPMATEVNPSLYEELKLGHEGAGFKRLVS